jgi:hypothetical protein
MMKRITALFLLMAVPAFAEDAKKFDFTQPLVSDGQPMIDEVKCPSDKDGKRPCETAVTLGELSFRALRAPVRGASIEDLIEREDLANGVRRATDWPLLQKQRDMILKAIAEGFPYPAIAAPAARMLGK